jgi:hypothetical protein
MVEAEPKSMSCAGLILLCERVAPVVFAKVVRDALQRSLGFGYAQMESPEAAEQTRQVLDHSKVRDQIIRVVFVHRLPPGYGPRPA